jgi:hypothetical protein
MPDFSVILQAPEVRAIVQENILERAFHDALFPRLLFRSEALPVQFPGGVGDTMIFTAPGLASINAQPLQPGSDPAPTSYSLEQWSAQIQQYAGTMDTNMPTSIVAIVNLFMRNAHQLGMQGAQTLNRLTRDKMYGAALDGWGVVDTAASSTTRVHVARLNGFTTARNPVTGTDVNTVRFMAVSPSNPLPVTIYDNGAATANTVVGYVPDNIGDQVGPGTLILGTAVTNVTARSYIIAYDRSQIDRVGGGLQTDSLTTSNIPTLADIRTAVANFWQENVPEHADGRFHAHLDPTSQADIFQDNEFQRLLTALPDYYVYKQFALGEMLNTVFFRNSECPIPETVNGGLTGTYSPTDPFPGEVWSKGSPSTSGSIPVHRILFTAQGGIMEYYLDMNQLITEAGVTGRVGDAMITNNGIEVFSDRIQMIIRAPLNRLQDTVSTSWKFMGDWPLRTDAATGNPSRYKRFYCIEHG